jgi:adenylate cyclase
MMIDYEIRTEAYRKPLRVTFNGTLIAATTRALVLHETRLRPRFYIPWSDVRTQLLAKTDYTTHCPFKGNASYWTVEAQGARAENAAWSYEEPLADAAALRGYVSFYPGKVRYEYDEEPGVFGETVDSPHANPIAGWLLREASQAPTPDRLVEQFCDCLLQNGVPLARMTVIIPTLHPQIFASVFVWREDDRSVRTIFEPHDILHQPKFAESPFAPIIGGAGGVRRRLEGADVQLDFPVVRDLHAEGATDYIAMPFHFSDGQINVMSMTSFAPGGFTTAHLGNIYEILPALGRMFEVHAQRRISVGLLDTYLGHNTGKRVLQGEIKLGDGQRIHAVIWFCDLRDSTRLSGSMDQASYLMNLNRFFTAMAGAIIDCGGEILSYIGDAVFAIFPIVDAASSDGRGMDAAQACSRAMAAATTAGERIAQANEANPDLPTLRYGIGLHVGDVTYGNIGVPERLQFTVIGSAANEASRIEGMTKDLGVPVLVSSKFAASYPGALVSRGAQALKGVSGLHELYALE